MVPYQYSSNEMRVFNPEVYSHYYGSVGNGGAPG